MLLLKCCFIFLLADMRDIGATHEHLLKKQSKFTSVNPFEILKSVQMDNLLKEVFLDFHAAAIECPFKKDHESN